MIPPLMSGSKFAGYLACPDSGKENSCWWRGEMGTEGRRGEGKGVRSRVPTRQPSSSSWLEGHGPHAAPQSPDALVPPSCQWSEHCWEMETGSFFWQVWDPCFRTHRLHFQLPNILQYQVEHNSQVSLKANYSHCSDNYRWVLGTLLLAVAVCFVTESMGAVFVHIGAMLMQVILGRYEVAMRSRDTIFRFSPFVFRVILE